MRNFRKGLHVIAAAQYVGDVGHGHQLHIGVHVGTEPLLCDGAVLLRQDVGELGTDCLCDLLPGEHVAVMLHDGDENLIPLLQKMPSVAVGHQVQALRGVSCEDDLLCGSRVQKAPHLLPGILIGICGRHGQLIQSPERIGILCPIVVVHCLQHTLRLLGGGGIVQIIKLGGLEDQKL